MRLLVRSLLAAAMISAMGSAAQARGDDDRGLSDDVARQSASPNPPSVQPAGTTLRQALESAYRHNPTLLAEQARLRSVDFRLPQARAGYGPRLSASAGYGYERDNFEQRSGNYVALGDWTGTATAILTQPLYSFGRTAAAERGANGRISFGRDSLRATEATVLLDTITAYSELLRDEKGVAIAVQNLELVQQEFSDTAIRLRARESTATDYKQVETRVGLARAQLLSAQERLATSRANFLRAAGYLPGELALPDQLPMPVVTLEAAYDFAQRNNPVLAAAYAREEVSRAAYNAARADMLPRIDLRGLAQTGTIEPYDGSLRQTTLRGEVLFSAPIFESGLRRARVDEAREANDSDWRLIDAALRDNRTSVASAWNLMVTQRAALGELQAAVRAAEIAYEGALLQEREGMRTTLDVLDLARELLLARTSLNASTSDAYVAQARLLEALGALSAARLLPDEPLYDPQVHYADARDNGDVPLITPLIRALDGLGYASNPAVRPNRDPASQMLTPGANSQITSGPDASMIER